MAVEDQVNPQTWELLMDRFDTLEGQNKEQLDLLRAHITDDAKVHKIVDRHSTYFKAASICLAPVVAFIGQKIGGWIKL